MKARRIIRLAALAWLALWLVATLGGETARLSPAERVTLDVKAYLAGEMAALERAARDLRAAAPAPDADGWNARADADAVGRMRAALGRMRDAYEHIEAGVVVLFPETDVSIDARYEGFAEGGADRDPFDGEGVTGMHAVERILWADAVAPEVIAFERSLREGAVFVAPSYPANEREAAGFRDGLVRRVVDDVAAMRRAFGPMALDPAAAYRGVVSSMREQHEKVDLAATAEEESRYARRTLADMRANLAGGRALFARFRPWLVSAGREADAAAIDARLAAIQARYDALPGDALPPVPPGWNPDSPTAEHRATAYGELHGFLGAESDPDREGSLAWRMERAGQALGVQVR